MTGIYEIINKINNKKYIGQAINIKSRWKNHIKDLNNHRHRNILLQRAWSKYTQLYGDNIFEFKIIKECHIEDLDDNEEYFISYYSVNNIKYGYNLDSGGAHGLHNEITKLKMSNSAKGKKMSKESKQKMSEKAKGKKLSKETKQKISNYQKNRPKSDNFKQKMSEIHSGKKLSEETKLKISQKCKGYKHTEETKQKISEAMKGKLLGRKNQHLSEETKQKIGEKVRKYNFDNNQIEDMKYKRNILNYSYQKIANNFNVSKSTIILLFKANSG